MGEDFTTRLRAAQEATEAVLESLLADQPLAGQPASNSIFFTVG